MVLKKKVVSKIIYFIFTNIEGKKIINMEKFILFFYYRKIVKIHIF